METRRLFLPVLLGTVRQGRESEKVANLILARIASHHPVIETVLIDPRTLDLPNDDEGTSLTDRNAVWRDAMLRADGLILVTPEYNHAFPGKLKDALDVLSKEYIHKAVGLVGVSSGWAGGARAIQSLVPVVRELGLAVTFTDLYFPRVGDSFGPEGQPLDDNALNRIDGFLTELSWMAQTLRWGRENVGSKYHG